MRSYLKNEQRNSLFKYREPVSYPSLYKETPSLNPLSLEARPNPHMDGEQHREEMYGRTQFREDSVAKRETVARTTVPLYHDPIVESKWPLEASPSDVLKNRSSRDEHDLGPFKIQFNKAEAYFKDSPPHSTIRAQDTREKMGSDADREVSSFDGICSPKPRALRQRSSFSSRRRGRRERRRGRRGGRRKRRQKGAHH